MCTTLANEVVMFVLIHNFIYFYNDPGYLFDSAQFVVAYLL